MAYNVFLPISNDGLILYLDSYNPKSYESGTLWNNLISSDNGTLVGASFSNNSINFNGTTDYIDYGSSTIASQLRGTNKFSISAWVKKTNSSSDLTIGAYDILTSTGWFLQWYSNNNIYVTVRDSLTPTNDNQTSLVCTNDWYNIVMIYNGAELLDVDKIIVYVNGELKSMTNNGSILSSVPNDVINLEIGNLVNYSNYFSGSLSTVTIYNKVLTELEVDQNYNALKNRFI